LDVFQFVIGEMFDTDERIMRGADSDEFVELYLNGGGAIAILRVLNQETPSGR
jgi:hypothetical protein